MSVEHGHPSEQQPPLLTWRQVWPSFVLVLASSLALALLVPLIGPHGSIAASVSRGAGLVCGLFGLGIALTQGARVAGWFLVVYTLGLLFLLAISHVVLMPILASMGAFVGLLSLGFFASFASYYVAEIRGRAEPAPEIGERSARSLARGGPK